MTEKEFTNRIDGLINDYEGGESTSKELRDGILDTLIELVSKVSPFEARVMPNEVLAGGNKRWKPKEKEIFYYVNFYTGVTEQEYTNSKIHTPRNLYKIGNCYKTREEAQVKWDQIKKILIQR